MLQNSTTIDSIQINPTAAHKASIIWLHGLGADGNDFASIVPELHLSNDLGIRFVFPHAPMIPVTINGGYVMRAWYDIVSLDVDKHADKNGIQQSVALLTQLIDHEVSLGIPTNKIIVAGFSQGAVVALTTGLTYAKQLGGILALSGYLPDATNVLTNAADANKTTPIFVGHGTQDTVVPYFLGQQTESALTTAGYTVAWHSYPMPHSVCMEEIDDIGRWIRNIFL